MNDPVILELINLLGKEKVLFGAAIKSRYAHIWKMDEPLTAKALLLPRTTEEVSKIMKICHEFEQPVCIHGGLTNLVGSTETQEEEVVISFEKMNRIVEEDPSARTITVEAGVILEHLQEAAKEMGMLFPLNFGSKGSAQIGGIIATNAGGLRVFKYGMTRKLVLGLEVVLADGTVLSSMKKIIKDNAAYDLKQLFIGSEGTLGILTKAVLKLYEAPKSRNSAFVAFNDYSKVIQFLKFMDANLAGALSGFELIWQKSYQTMTGVMSGVKPPIPHNYKYYILLESLGSNQSADKRLLEQLLLQVTEMEMIEEAVMAHTHGDLNWFWGIREDVHTLVKTCKFDQHFDVSVPIPQIGPYVEETVAKLNKIKGVTCVYPFGHMADGNIHFIVGKETADEALKLAINDCVYADIKKLNGSVSAEHGIGLNKKQYLHLCKSEQEISVMKLLKRSLDPKNILNRAKVFDV